MVSAATGLNASDELKRTFFLLAEKDAELAEKDARIRELVSEGAESKAWEMGEAAKQYTRIRD